MTKGILSGLGAVLRWLFTKLWEEPASIRGVPWTLALWVYLLCGFYLLEVLAQSHQPVFVPLCLMTVASLVMRWQGKPGKLGRQLPYHRTRRRW